MILTQSKIYDTMYPSKQIENRNADTRQNWCRMNERGYVLDVKLVRFFPQKTRTETRFVPLKAPVLRMRLVCRFGVVWTLRYSYQTRKYSVQGQPTKRWIDRCNYEMVEAQRLPLDTSEVRDWLRRVLGPALQEALDILGTNL